MVTSDKRVSKICYQYCAAAGLPSGEVCGGVQQGLPNHASKVWFAVSSALRLEKPMHTATAQFVEAAWFLGLLLLESEAWMWRTALALKFKSWDTGGLHTA